MDLKDVSSEALNGLFPSVLPLFGCFGEPTCLVARRVHNGKGMENGQSPRSECRLPGEVLEACALVTCPRALDNLAKIVDRVPRKRFERQEVSLCIGVRKPP